MRGDRVVRAGLALAALALFPAAAAAQEPEKVEDKTKETEGITGLWGRLFDEVELKGYFEAHYNNPELGTMSRKDPARADLHRVVFGLEYAFTEFVKFEAEVEFEHGGSGIEIEEAFVEYEPVYELGFVAGGLLMPVGLINPDHKPVNFYSVERPYVDRSLVPSTWMEFGIGAYGRIPEAHLEGRVYLVEGLDATAFDTIDGIRGGRGAGRESLAEDLAVVARVVYSPLPGLLGTVEGEVEPPDPGYAFGASVYYGHADHDNVAVRPVPVMLLEADGRYMLWNFELRGQAVYTTIGNADDISVLTTETIGETQQGWYAEIGYHLIAHWFPDAVDELVVFGRHENIDTNKSVAAGFSRDDRADRDIWSFGVAYFPVPKVVFKADVEFWKDETGKHLTRFNLGFGLVF